MLGALLCRRWLAWAAKAGGAQRATHHGSDQLAFNISVILESNHRAVQAPSQRQPRFWGQGGSQRHMVGSDCASKAELTSSRTDLKRYILAPRTPSASST